MTSDCPRASYPWMRVMTLASNRATAAETLRSTMYGGAVAPLSSLTS